MAISSHIELQNPAAALRVRAAIYESLQNLILFPLIGREQKAPTVRKLITSRYAYLVYYRVDEEAEEIIILNVKHPAQQRHHDDA